MEIDSDDDKKSNFLKTSFDDEFLNMDSIKMIDDKIFQS